MSRTGWIAASAKHPPKHLTSKGQRSSPVLGRSDAVEKSPVSRADVYRPFFLGSGGVGLLQSSTAAGWAGRSRCRVSRAQEKMKGGATRCTPRVGLFATKWMPHLIAGAAVVWLGPKLSYSL